MDDIQTTDSHISEGAAVDQDAVESLARMYAEYLRVDSKQQVQGFDDSIDELLSRLDEYHGLLDMIRSDSSLCLQKTLPIIHEKGLEMQGIFNKIDQLVAFVAMVKDNLTILEQQVEAAESDMGSLSAVKKVFSSISLPSFLSSKKQSTPDKSPVRSKPPYSSPHIFKTSDYMTPKMKTAESSSDVASLKLDTPSREEAGQSETFIQSTKVTVQDPSQSDESDPQVVGGDSADAQPQTDFAEEVTERTSMEEVAQEISSEVTVSDS